MSTHTSFPKKTKVHIIMENGDIFVDKFVDKKSGRICFEELGWLKIKDIRSMTIWRGNKDPT